MDHVAESLGPGPHLDFNAFMAATEQRAKKQGIKITAKRQKLIQTALAEKDEDAAPIIKKVYRPGKTEPNPLYGRFEVKVNGRSQIVEYEADSELRDVEQVPLLEEGGIEAFFLREVLPPSTCPLDGRTLGLVYEWSPEV